jgi:N-acetylglutamate synthase-like GNAT family acetyltransferase
MQGLAIARTTDGDPAPLAELINAAYAIAEGGFWVDGTRRTNPVQVAEILAQDGFLRAELDGRLVGCARVRRLDATTAELGLVAVAPDGWGQGVGTALVAAAEDHARGLGAATIELKVLAATDPSHPEKRTGWYERLGFRYERSEPFEADGLVRECEFRYFRKPLQ